MPSLKAKKTKVGATSSSTGRAPNQPSLFSFWGKPTKKKIGGSKDTSDSTGSSQQNEEVVATCTGNKRRRVESEDVSSSPSAATIAAVSTPEFHQSNNNKKTESNSKTNSNVPAVLSTTTSLQRFSYREDQGSVGKENKTPKLCTNNNEIESPTSEKRANNNDKNSKGEPKNKDNGNDAIEDIDTAEPETKEASQSDSEQEEEDEDNNSKSQNDDPQTNDNQKNPQGLSDYELLRLRNIARNNARLEALGLLPNNQDSRAEPKPKKRASKRPANKKNNEQPVMRRSTRRSTRLSKPVDTENANAVTVTTLNAEEKTSSAIAMEEEESVVYEVSPVVHYEMKQQQQQQKPSLLSETTNDNRSKNNSDSAAAAASLVPLGYRLAPPQGLSAIYSLNFYDTTEWIVGAGKAGIIALWNCGQPPSPPSDSEQRSGTDNDDVATNYVDPMISWKGHGGRWISEAQFLTDHDHDAVATPTMPSRLVTAANDGTVCLWDLRQVSSGTGIPKLIQQSNKSWHASGIFAMDVAPTTTAGTAKIATGSKDKTVAIADLISSDNSCRPSTPYWRSYIHSAKVGAVKFRDEHVLATASDDGSVAILDDRMKDGEGPPVAVLENLHQGRPHSVVWQDNASPILLTAGLDSVIQGWDIRYLNQESPLPVLEFYGHVPTSTRRCKRIHHPVLYQYQTSGGQFVLTGGEGSHALSMFEMQQPLATSITVSGHTEQRNLIRSAVYSRGSLPDDCCHTDIGSIAVQQDLVAATVDGEVLLLRPSS